MERELPSTRDAYQYFTPIQTRWMDNDAYGHVNNVVYYSFFDTALTKFLIERGLIGAGNDGPIGLVVSTQCQYFVPISFPSEVVIGLSVAAVGNSSVRYNLAAFENDALSASAQGQFVHVYVTQDSRRPVALPSGFQQKLKAGSGTNLV